MWQLVVVLLREETLAATSGTHIGPAQRDERWLPRVATRLGLAQRNVGVDGQQLALGLLGGIDYSSDDGSFGNLLNDLECRGDWRAWRFVNALHRIMTKQWRAWLKLQCSGMEWLTMLKMDGSAVVVTEAPVV